MHVILSKAKNPCIVSSLFVLVSSLFVLVSSLFVLVSSLFVLVSEIHPDFIPGFTIPHKSGL